MSEEMRKKTCNCNCNSIKFYQAIRGMNELGRSIACVTLDGGVCFQYLGPNLEELTIYRGKSYYDDIPEILVSLGYKVNAGILAINFKNQPDTCPHYGTPCAICS